MAIATPTLTPEEARAALAAEWASRSPGTPAEILQFYRESEHLADDLEAFHTFPDRQRWTDVLVHVARQFDARHVLDIGCGAGHDLRTLRQLLAHDVWLGGVEPNDALRQRLMAEGFAVAPAVEGASIETADLLACFDVLEHVPEPEAFLGGIAQRAKLGALLVETCATHDVGTPLHLPENRGWRTGRVLEAHGWEKAADEGRLRVWQKVSDERVTHTSLILCAYRGVSLPTLRSMLELYRHDGPKQEYGWRTILGGEAGINRARSIAVSRWFTDTAEDVCLMVDDDITFAPRDAERLVSLCRDGHDVVAAAYPVRDGGHLALRGLGQELTFGPGLPPVPMRYVSTGFLAIHRKVIAALVERLPLCHANSPASFWPLFDFRVVPEPAVGGHEYQSEDWYFCDRAREAGFGVWLDPTIALGHLAQLELNVRNMHAVRDALAAGR